MKKRTIFAIFTFVIALILPFVISNEENIRLNDSSLDEQGNLVEPMDIALNLNGRPKAKFNEGKLLVKYNGNISEINLEKARAVSIEPLYKNSKWNILTLKHNVDTFDTVSYLRKNNIFDEVDYDYIMANDNIGESEANDIIADIAKNPYHNSQHNLNTHEIKEAWKYMDKNFNKKGGSPDVIVAVIDTGVDYNHLDLRDNIWTNINEIPNNGIDDDNNGYVDDYYGYDFVGNDKDPMDDNGHGTHVAGVIAASNNDIGVVGVAYNCKIMSLKAGSSSGYFLQSHLAKAIEYAYMNGASVINMSLGGNSISMAVEDALMNAYNQCVLVAAAGNDGLCNNLKHSKKHSVGISYPAALPYVIGVMSTNQDGKNVSSFSNYDDTPYDKIEYEVYAVGESVYSTFPNNKYAKLQGTSMAAPSVAGIAALLRSAYPDREVFSTKYLQSQIVNTGNVHPHNHIIKYNDGAHSVSNAHFALTKVLTPSVSLYDYYIFDNEEFSDVNNGDGIVDAGETIHLAVELQNRGGVAKDINVTIDTIRSGDSDITDPYFTFVNNKLSLSDIGTYSVRDGNKIYDENDNVIDTEHHFEIIVSEDCPNEYICDFNINFTYKNGLDEKDKTTYTRDPNDDKKLQLTVSSGMKLPSVINEDTTFYAGRRYIISEDVIIPEGVTVNFEEGCIIQFYENSGAYYDSIYNSPEIKVYGTLNFNGTQDNMIKIMPSDNFDIYTCIFYIPSGGSMIFNYTDAANFGINSNSYYIDTPETYSNNSKFYIKYSVGLRKYSLGKVIWDQGNYPIFREFNDSIFKNYGSYEFKSFSANRSVFYTSSHSDNQKNITLQKSNDCIFYVYSNLSQYENNTGIFDFIHVVNTDDNINVVKNNIFIAYNSKSIANLPQIKRYNKDLFVNNTFISGYNKYGDKLIKDFYDSHGNPTVDLNYKAESYDNAFPFILDFKIINSEGKEVKTIGKEEVTFELTFSRDMDTSSPITLGFGTVEPYSDYIVDGDYVNKRVWRGTYELKAFIENGTQQMSIRGGHADGEPFKTLVPNISNWEFNIDTAQAMSMTMFADSTDEGIELSWLQDDYDTLMGYNVYRSDSKDGNYVRINPSLISPEENVFFDDNAEPGKTYWYTFTVVLTDFSESAPAGKINATMNDTILPNLYHTPVNQAYENNNLVISCTASDNVGISEVTLYYRTKGESTWKTLNMSKQNDKYSATIYGSEITLAGLEYYIVASDNTNQINKGSAENPYKVVVKDASSISRYGDVDGDGTITTKDALMIMQAINGDKLLTDDQFKRADLNKNGNLDSVEALRILQYINGKVTTLEM